MKQVFTLSYSYRFDSEDEFQKTNLTKWFEYFKDEMFHFSSLCENELIYTNDEGTWKVHIYKPIYDDYYSSSMSIETLLSTYAEMIHIVEYEYEGKFKYD